MSNDNTINSMSLGLFEQDNWAFFGAKKLVETLGLPLSVISGIENLNDADVLIVPRVTKEDEKVLLGLVDSGHTLITEGGITGTGLEEALGVIEQKPTLKDGVIVLHRPERDVLLPPLLEYLHKGSDISNDDGRYYEVGGNRYSFDIARNIGRGRIILLSSLLSLVSRTYSWISGSICNQDLMSQPYLDVLGDIFLKILAEEANRRNRALARTWYYPDFRQEAATLITFDIDDKYSCRHTLVKSPCETGRKWAFNLLFLPLSRFLSLLKRSTELRLTTRSKEAAGVGFFIRLWKGLNGLFTPNFLGLVERAGGKAVLFLRPPGIQDMESKDRTAYRLESYEIRREDVKRVSVTHEVALHFGRSLITIGDVMAEDVRSCWTDGISEQLADLEKATGIKIYGARGHFSLIYPDTVAGLEAAGCTWDSTYYGQQRWISPDGKTVEFGYSGYSPSWTASPVGMSLPFYPVIAGEGVALRESTVLEVPTTLYEPRDSVGVISASIENVRKYHGVVNIQYHPFDAANYADLRRILRYLKGGNIWKTTGKELSEWWWGRKETRLRGTRIGVSGEELTVEVKDMDTVLGALSLVILLPEGMNISGVKKVVPDSLNIHDYEIDPANSMVKLKINTKR